MTTPVTNPPYGSNVQVIPKLNLKLKDHHIFSFSIEREYKTNGLLVNNGQEIKHYSCKALLI